MHVKAAALLEAHSQHLLGQVSPENLPATLQREVNAFLDWASVTPINRVISVERIQADWLMAITSAYAWQAAARSPWSR